ncbi:hypothetical protein [Listeria newyorkensis]|uniref:hypothetical protein n=1 Tax=Listeria newyorkensis TaxID=1497681 RepID=UPI00051D3A5D|nr:hypothetical protein [Listeria newyorkensis]KGL45732.1 hypothetical protein EP58_03315 [Listeria newyorkensis]SQC55330.1 Uncharacterised protein [Listeria newyorkensis]
MTDTDLLKELDSLSDLIHDVLAGKPPYKVVETSGGKNGTIVSIERNISREEYLHHNLEALTGDLLRIQENIMGC